MGAKRVLVVDGQPVSGVSLHLLIEQQTGYSTTACTLDDDVHACVADFKPDMIVVNLHPPKLAAELIVCRTLADLPSEPLVLLLATNELLADPNLLVEAFEVGAAGMLNRDTLQVEDLVSALRELADGQQLWDTREVQQALRERKAAQIDDAEEARNAEQLTAREREVFALMAEGASNSGIAERLGISERTAQGHVSRVLTKLDVRSRAEAIALYYRLSHAADSSSPVSQD